MADEPRKEDPEPPAEPVKDTDPGAEGRNEPTDEIQPEVIDDDRFQATDN